MALPSDEVIRAKMLGEFLRCRRLELGRMSRKDVARAAGVSDTWYAWLEQGRARPSAAVLDAVARALKLQSFEQRLLRQISAGLLPTVPAKPTVSIAVQRLLERVQP